MKVRRRSLLIPAIALLGILFALWVLFHRREVPPLPDVIALPLPVAAPSKSAPSAPAAIAKLPAPPTAASEEEAKKTQAEMKASLSAMYGAEKSFFAEYNRYTTDLDAAGYLPEPGKPMRAKLGFLHAFHPPDTLNDENPDFMSSEEFANAPHYNLKFTPEAEAARLDDAARFCRQGCSASDSGFEIAIVTTTNGQPDVWIINQDKVITHESALAPK